MDLQIREHNLAAYNNVVDSFKTSNKSCVVHATGTGKAYIALQLIRDMKCSETAVYVTSYVPNLVTFKELVMKYLPEKYSSVDFVIYAGLKRYVEEKHRSSNYIILDEFHRCGADVWSQSVDALLDVNKRAKVLGLSATPIRYLDNERDMSDEMFDGNVVSELNLKDALTKGILPTPDYYASIYSFEEDIKNAEEKINGLSGEKKEQAQAILKKAKRMIEEASGIDEFFRENMNISSGKYIVFCRNYEHMKQMEEESKRWFAGSDIHQYELYTENRNSKKIFKKFQEDKSDSLRLCFCISMLNEGVHVDGIDGVILLRPTASLNIYYQQIGRALSIGTTDHPKIYDVVNNISSLKDVMGLTGESFEEMSKDARHTNDNDIINFSISAEYIEIIKCLEDINNIASFKPWDEAYLIAKRYAEINGSINNVKSKEKFEGFCLYNWIRKNKQKYRTGIGLTGDKVAKLEALGVNFDYAKKTTWDEWYELAEEYCSKNNDIKYKTMYKGKNIGYWLSRQKQLIKSEKCNLTDEQKSKLLSLCKDNREWTDEEMSIVKEFYEKEGSACANRLKNRTKKSVIHIARKNGVSNGRFWTEEEDNILKQYYPEEGACVSLRLKERSKSACQNRASFLNVKREGRIWTPEEDAIIMKYYEQDGAAAVSSRLPSRTADACKGRAQRIIYHNKT